MANSFSIKLLIDSGTSARPAAAISWARGGGTGWGAVASFKLRSLSDGQTRDFNEAGSTASDLGL
ncbi:hypothetical protein E2C01_013296 [Portunus trituberculatus]|uniref:Uncharacterized protein n=1 Tax=Portunus trituberculatus TaxID=210409 RepID=A0A5B7DGY6_PORTR|nr:hypothetical protein [Portunus trituberculatus]